MKTRNGAILSYDGRGNLTNDGTRTYHWSAVNELLEVRQGTTTVLEAYQYNADGQRVQVRSGSTRTVFMEGLWEETHLDGITQPAVRQYYTLQGRVVGVRVRAAGASATQVYALHGDHLGSIGITIDTNGSVTHRQEFDPWGSVIATTGTAQTRRSFTGQYGDTTGLLYYNARYYHPALGRFISADTIVPGSTPLTVAPLDALARNAWSSAGGGAANPQDLNRYAYVGNNPVNDTDPTGHCGVRTGCFDGSGGMSRADSARSSQRRAARAPYGESEPGKWRRFQF